MKLLKIMVAALLLAAMVTPAIAEDRLSLSGEMRVRGWHTDYGKDFDLDDDNTSTWADQRLRIGGKIAVAEGVSVTFRFDVTESNWGNTGSGNYFGSGRSGSDGSNQWDRAHLDLVKGDFHLRAGQFLQVYSVTDSVDAQDNGLSADYKLGNGSINVFFQVDDNNDGTSPKAYTITNGVVNTTDRPNQDTFLYGAKYSGKFDNFGLDLYGGGWKGDDGLNVMMGGVNATLNLDAFKLVGAVDMFGGDHDSDTDAMGTQAMFDGSFAFSEKFTLGGQLFYAKGDDEDVQYTRIGNGFNGWDPIFDVGTNLSNEQIVFGSPFNLADFGGGEAGSSLQIGSLGSVGGRLYVGFKASDAFKFGASAAYLQEENDKNVQMDVTALAAGMVWSFMPNTSFHAQAQYTTGTIEPDGGSDLDLEVLAIGTGLYVNF